MKKSNRVPLLLIGTGALLVGYAVTSDDKRDLQQNTYASREDCRKDWGDDERDCRPEGSGGSGGGGGGGGGRYVGPRYYWDHNTGYPYAVDADGSTRRLPNSYLTRGAPSTAQGITRVSVSRGGFGSTGRGFSGGG